MEGERVGSFAIFSASIQLTRRQIDFDMRRVAIGPRNIQYRLLLVK